MEGAAAGKFVDDLCGKRLTASIEAFLNCRDERG